MVRRCDLGARDNELRIVIQSVSELIVRFESIRSSIDDLEANHRRQIAAFRSKLAAAEARARSKLREEMDAEIAELRKENAALRAGLEEEHARATAAEKAGTGTSKKRRL